MQKSGSHESEIVMDNESIGNRKYVCSGAGVCGSPNSEYQYQFPCATSTDCAPLSGPPPWPPVQCTTGNDITPDKTFGNTKETGCKDRPWDFVADYNCPSGEMDVVRKSDGGGGYGISWNKIEDMLGVTVPNNFFVCVAKPRVYVLDNWGWCASRPYLPDGSGGCNYDSNVKVQGYGCYSEKTSTINECKPSAKEPWVNYNGNVIVIPIQ